MHQERPTLAIMSEQWQPRETRELPWEREGKRMGDC
jgi:hypothetical protein